MPPPASYLHQPTIIMPRARRSHKTRHRPKKMMQDRVGGLLHCVVFSLWVFLLAVVCQVPCTISNIGRPSSPSSLSSSCIAGVALAFFHPSSSRSSSSGGSTANRRYHSSAPPLPQQHDGHDGPGGVGIMRRRRRQQGLRVWQQQTQQQHQPQDNVPPTIVQEQGQKKKKGPQLSVAEQQKQQQHQKKKKEAADSAAAEVVKEDVNVVLTHAICDFDSLASAVGLAKLWRHQHPEREAFVCMPQGAHPSVEAFLALHSVLFPIRPLASLDPAHIDKLGVVDASTKDRLGAGQSLLTTAKEVHVFDHHAMKTPDIDATKLHLEDVGSVTTMVVERLKENQVDVTDAEATLLAIGIHADTGSMTYDCTTVRDVEALAWVMRHGARQPIIAEFCHQRLTREQQTFLSQSFVNLNSTVYEGVNIGTVVVDCHEYVGGLARVAQHVLELTSCDVLVWGGLYVQGSGRKQTKRLVLIGRARSGVNFVDFDEIFRPLGGGGHMKAAAANIKFEGDMSSTAGAEATVMASVVEKLKGQVQARQDRKMAKDIMDFPVLTVYRNTTMAQVAQLLRKYGIHAVPVVAGEGPAEEDVVLGVVTDVEVLKAFKAGKMDSPVAGWLLKKIGMVGLDTPVDTVKRVMAENDGRDVLVMDQQQQKLVGLISRTDILQSYHVYSDDSFAPKEAFCNEEKGEKGEGEKENGCHVCSAHTDCPEFVR